MKNKIIFTALISTLSFPAFAHGIPEHLSFVMISFLIAVIIFSIHSLINIFNYVKKSKNKIKAFFISFISFSLFGYISLIIPLSLLFIFGNLNSSFYILEKISSYLYPFISVFIYFKFYKKILNKIYNKFI
jgi:hypothetical protein